MVFMKLITDGDVYMLLASICRRQSDWEKTIPTKFQQQFGSSSILSFTTQQAGLLYLINYTC